MSLRMFPRIVQCNELSNATMRLTHSLRARRIYQGALLWAGLWGGLTAHGQVPANISLPNATIASGNATFEATSSISATSGFLIDGTASVTFQSGGTVTLGPGFTAIGGGSGTSFTAFISTPATANFSFTLPSAASVALGQRTSIQGSVTPASGFTGSITPIIASALPPGVSVSFSPTIIQVTGSSSVSFTMTFSAGIGASANSAPANVLVTAEGAPAQWSMVALTINSLPLPVITLSQPTPGTLSDPTSVWGAIPLQGYALEPTPFLQSEAISSVNISIARDDDTSYSVTGTASYGSTSVPRYDACGGNGITGAYPGSPGCPYVNYSYTWNTGVSPVTGAFIPNAIYTATLTASDNSSPAVTNSIQGTFTVDNQTPAPAISSPIDGSGSPGVQQIFTVVYTSPHSNLDFYNGQISFQGFAATCVVQWTLAGSVTALSNSSVCTVSAAASSVTNNGTNQVTVQAAVTFTEMYGQVAVSAYGSNSLQQEGPPSQLTTYTLGSGPTILTNPGEIYVLTSAGSATSACLNLAFINGAQGPVTVGTPVLTWFAGTQNQPTLTATPLTSSQSQPVSCAAGSVLVTAEFPAGTATGTVYQFALPLTDSKGTTAQANGIAMVSTSGQFYLSVPTTAISVMQGSSVSAPFTVSSQGFTGTVSLTLYPQANGPSVSLDTSSWNLTPGVSDTSHVTFTVPATMAPGIYSAEVWVEGTGAYTQWATAWVNVIPNITPDFTISAFNPVSIQAGQSINFSGVISPVPLSGYTGTVKLTGLAPGDAPGISLPDSVSIASGPQSFTGTITSLTSTVTCSYTLPVSAVSGSLQHSGSVPVYVQGGAAPFAMPSWGSVGVTQGQSSSLVVNATASSCFTGAASFAAAGFPSGIQFTYPSSPPTITGPVLATSPVSAGSITVNAASSVTPGAYSGTLTVTLGGVAYTNPLVVTVSPVATSPAPSYTISCTNCPTQGEGGFVLTPGGSVTALIAMTPQAGYTNSPFLYPPLANLPAGVTVSYDNSGIESAATGDVVAATISASATAPSMAESYIWVTSWDSTLPAAIGLPIYITVNGTAVTTPPAITPAPLSATTSVFYSNVNPLTQNPTVATLAVTPAGGTPPYSSTLSNDISWGPVTQVNSLAYSISGFTSSRHATLTVTDSSTPHQTTPPIDVFVPAPQPYPDAYLQTAVLGRVSAVESLASSLCPAGTTTCGVRNDIQTRLGISSTQYSSLVTLASQLHGAHITNRATARNAINSLHSSAKTVQNATSAQLSALQSSYASEAALPAQYQSSVAALFGAGFSGYDGNAWTLLGGDLSDCDPYFGCDPCDPHYYVDCAVGGDYGNAVAYADTQIVIDAATGSYQAFTEESVALGSGALAADKGVCVSVSVNIGTPYGNPTQPVCNTFGYSISQIYGVATQTGTYVATGTTLDYDPCIGASGACSAPIEVPPLTTRDFSDFSPTACSPPTIYSISVNGLPISQLVIPTSGTSNGTMTILGACLDSTTQVSVAFNPSGGAPSSGGVELSSPVSIGAVTTLGWGEVSAQYSVSSSATPGSLNLVVSTAEGSASGNLDVVASPGIYIDSVTPSVWSEGSQTTVTVLGSGFGSSQGSLGLTVNAPGSPGDAALLSILSWTDNMIVAQVATSATSGGDTVTVTVTGGSDYGLVTGFAQQSGAGTGGAASQNVNVAPAGQPTLQVTCNGQPVNSSICSISSTPAFPNLVASLVSPSGQTLSGNVQWTFSTVYDSPPYKGFCPPPVGSPVPCLIWYEFYFPGPTGSVSQTVAAGAAWTVRNSLNQICGGLATISYTYGSFQGSVTFYILGHNTGSNGANPSVSTVQAALSAYPWTPPQPWYLLQLVNQESSYYQFNPPGTNEYRPDWGPPLGFGLMQVDLLFWPDSYQSVIFDWTQNVTLGSGILKGYIASANTFWSNQQSTFADFNEGILTNNVIPSPLAAPPDDVFEGGPLGAAVCSAIISGRLVHRTRFRTLLR